MKTASSEVERGTRIRYVLCVPPLVSTIVVVRSDAGMYERDFAPSISLLALITPLPAHE